MGTVVNAIAVILGSLIGLLIRRGLSERVEETATKMLGVAVLLVGLEGGITSMITVGTDGTLAANDSLLLIASMVVGGVAGEMWNLEGRFNAGGRWIERRFGREGFAKGFVNASLLFCVGALAIIGALNDGLTGDAGILYIKSTLDFMIAIILSSTLGFGVLFSFIPIAIYQGSITLLAGLISPLISDQLLNHICMIGYTIVMCIGINFLKFTSIKTANLLPCLLIPIGYHAAAPYAQALRDWAVRMMGL